MILVLETVDACLSCLITFEPLDLLSQMVNPTQGRAENRRSDSDDSQPRVASWNHHNGRFDNLGQSQNPDSSGLG